MKSLYRIFVCCLILSWSIFGCDSNLPLAGSRWKSTIKAPSLLSESESANVYLYFSNDSLYHWVGNPESNCYSLTAFHYEESNGVITTFPFFGYLYIARDGNSLTIYPNDDYDNGRTYIISSFRSDAFDLCSTNKLNNTHWATGFGLDSAFYDFTIDSMYWSRRTNLNICYTKSPYHYTLKTIAFSDYLFQTIVVNSDSETFYGPIASFTDSILILEVNTIWYRTSMRSLNFCN